MTDTLRPISVRIIADDLTGACDAAVAFSCVGMSVEVEPAWGAHENSMAQVVAFNTESRDVQREESIARITEAAARMIGNDAHYLFKKIDSVFRGNTFLEIACCLSSIPHALAILAPAYPELGRILTDGQLYSSDLAGTSTLPVEQLLHDSGVYTSRIGAGSGLAERIKNTVHAGAKILLCDSHTHQDLVEVVCATLAMNISGRILWIGSGGLAHAVAANLRPARVPPCPVVTGGEVLFLIGSNHAVTEKQVAHLRLTHPECIVLPIPRGIHVEDLRQTIETYVPGGIGSIFATGGDTALAFCRAAEITCLKVQCEFERGLPQTRIVGGPLDGATLILKSGGFGDEEILSRIARTFSTEKERSSC